MTGPKKSPHNAAITTVNNAAQTAAGKITGSVPSPKKPKKAVHPASVIKSKTPDTTGKLVNVGDYYLFFKNMSSAQLAKLLPKEITPHKFLKVLKEIIKEKEGAMDKVTTSILLGDVWERCAMDYPQVQETCHTVLKWGALELLKDLLKEHTAGKKSVFNGFLNGSGDFTTLEDLFKTLPNQGTSTGGGKVLKDMLELLIGNAQKSQNLEELKNSRISANDVNQYAAGLLKSGVHTIPVKLPSELMRLKIEYADSFNIGTAKFKDGCFIIMIGGHCLFLVDLEFKTAGSKGVKAQSASLFVRFAGAKNTDELIFKIHGAEKTIPIGNVLFNPIDLDAHLAIKQGSSDRGDFADVNQKSDSVTERVISQTEKRKKIAAGEQTAFGDDLASLVTDLYKIGIDTNLTLMRKLIFDFLKNIK